MYVCALAQWAKFTFLALNFSRSAQIGCVFVGAVAVIRIGAFCKSVSRLLNMAFRGLQ